MTVTPAILPHSFEELTNKLTQVEGLVSRVQVDLCDGVFGREKTWLPEGNESLPSNFSYEFDIMTVDWKLYTMRAIMLGATSVVAHVDGMSDVDLDELIALASQRKVSLGISISNDKPIEVHADFVRKAKSKYDKVYIQVMGIEKVGEQGGEFDESAIERVRNLKQQFGDMKVQVDGGMTPETAAKVVSAGAETTVSGSYIFNGEDPSGAIGRLSQVETIV